MTATKPDPMSLTGATAIADFLGITVRQVRHWHEKRVIPSFKIRGSLCAESAKFREWVERQTAETCR